MFCLTKVTHGYKYGRYIGKGSYGNVTEVTKNDKKYALKQIKLMNYDDIKKVHREIQILKFLSNYKFSVKIYDGWIENGDTVNLIIELYDTDLSKLSRNVVTETHLKYIAFQLFLALHELHSAGIIHRDIKPSNVLINGSDCGLALCDYNLSTVFDTEDHSKSKSLEVASKWYQAPELLRGNEKYGCGIDIWAAGCVLAEIFLDKPVWSNDTKQDMLDKILFSLGHKIDSEPFCDFTSEFTDFLKYIFCVDYLKRPTAKEILSHPFISSMGLKPTFRVDTKILCFEDSTDIKKIQDLLEFEK
jgi:serine/threonine protein kinase